MAKMASASALDDSPPKTENKSVPRVSFQQLAFSDGTQLFLGESDIVAFVGPNNAGKSAALKELELFVGTYTGGKVVTAAKVDKVGSVDALRGMLEETALTIESGKKQFHGLGFAFAEDHIPAAWARLDPVRGLFCRRASTETRITDSNPQHAIPLRRQAPAHPIQLLYRDDRIAQKLSSYFEKAFGMKIHLDYGGGSEWPLRVGPEVLPESGEDRHSGAYLDRLAAHTELLHLQGDGMRSFMSVLLHMLAPRNVSILLLDEPEAFLHPPQARLLGEFIAKEKPKNCQLFVATHSADVLQGLVNAAANNLRIVRLQRDGTKNRAKELDKNRTKDIGSDPLLRFSSALQGIFHQRVIVCESDADCMFYSSILSTNQVNKGRQPDVLFVYANGKQRVAKIIEALRALDVDVDAIVDIDVLNDEEVLKKITTAFDVNWDDISGHAKAIRDAVAKSKPWLTSLELANEIERIIKDVPQTGEFPREARKNIEALFKKASPWDALKSAGEAAIPGGQPTKHFKELCEILANHRLWIVPVGELEGFCRIVGSHGPRWVQQVIETYDTEKAPELSEARKFIGRIWNR